MGYKPEVTSEPYFDIDAVRMYRILGFAIDAVLKVHEPCRELLDDLVYLRAFRNNLGEAIEAQQLDPNSVSFHDYVRSQLRAIGMTDEQIDTCDLHTRRMAQASGRTTEEVVAACATDYERRMTAAGLDPVAIRAEMHRMMLARDAAGVTALTSRMTQTILDHESRGI